MPLRSGPRSSGHAGGLVKTLIRRTVPRPIRNWLRSPAKSSEWLWDTTRFWLGCREVLTISPEWSMVCHPRACKVAYQAQIVDREQSVEFRNFLAYCGPNMLLYDIGAHFGMFSLAAARFGGRAVAVDPSPTAARMVRIQARLNECADRIEVVVAAASDTSGVIRLLSSGVFSNGYLRIAMGRPFRELSPARAIAIDDMVGEYGVPTHIKIDVEGYEAAVLRGARHTLTRASPVLFLELHNELLLSEGGNPHLALDELAALGYKTVSLSGRTVTSNEILKQPIVRLIARRVPS